MKRFAFWSGLFKLNRKGNFKGRRKYLPVLFAILGAIVAVNLFAGINYQLYGLDFSVDAKIASPGSSRLVIPPIGEITARTHWTPLQLTANLRNIDLTLLRTVVFSTPDAFDNLTEVIEGSGHRLLTVFLIKSIIIAGLGGIAGVYLVRPQRLLDYAAGALIGMVIVAVVASVTYSVFDVEAFENPEFRGVLEAAPWMVNLLRESVVRVEELGEQVQLLASNLYSAFQRLEDLRPVGVIDADITVLHVSDIHNNPVAFDFVYQVLQSYPVDFIIDTGDLTDWGTALEAEIVNRIAILNRPYVFTSGNHDSPGVMERLARTENVYIVANGDVELFGLALAGTGDYGAKSYAAQSAPLPLLEETANRINDAYREVEPPPDIFAVHNHRIARMIEPGIFPTVLYGHNHLQEIEQVESTVYINAGTTGAAGIRGFQTREMLPFSLALLYFEQDEETEKPLLVAIDGIRVAGLRSRFSLERTFVDYGRNQSEDVEIIDGFLLE